MKMMKIFRRYECFQEEKVFKFKSNQFQLLEKIGEGGQGTVYTAVYSFSDTGEALWQDLQAQDRDDHDPLGVDQKHERTFVAKKFRKGHSGQWPEEVFGLHFSCQWICQFDGYCIDEDGYFYLLMQKYDCSLRDVIDKRMKKRFWNGRPFPDDLNVILTIMRIALGMRFLHENNIMHRDLKADNVFVNVSSDNYPISCFIGDFDVASYVVGILFWRAPEILQALKDGKSVVFTPKADV
jgi:serine/threonine protein kinase